MIMMWVWRERLAPNKGNKMKIKEAKQLLEDHSITEDNYGGFRTIHCDRGQFIPMSIVTKEVRKRNTYTQMQAVTFFVAKRVVFSTDGTWIISNEETLIRTAKCDEGCRVTTSAMHAVKTHEHETAIANRIASLPSKEQIAELLGVNEWNVSCHSRVQKFTITLSLSQMEALLGKLAK